MNWTFFFRILPTMPLILWWKKIERKNNIWGRSEGKNEIPISSIVWIAVGFLNKLFGILFFAVINERSEKISKSLNFFFCCGWKQQQQPNNGFLQWFSNSKFLCPSLYSFFWKCTKNNLFISAWLCYAMHFYRFQSGTAHKCFLYWIELNKFNYVYIQNVSVWMTHKKCEWAKFQNELHKKWKNRMAD